ncbi:MAG: hypothetical protein ACR2PJ_06310 [Pseudomonadales bacterium]
MNKVALETDQKLITCILPKGRAIPLRQKLVEEQGIYTSVIHSARGVGRFSPVRDRGIGEQQEKDILQLTVAAEDADDLFEYMFFEGDMNKPHAGIIFVTPAVTATRLTLPDLPWV